MGRSINRISWWIIGLGGLPILVLFLYQLLPELGTSLGTSSARVSVPAGVWVQRDHVVVPLSETDEFVPLIGSVGEELVDSDDCAHAEKNLYLLFAEVAREELDRLNRSQNDEDPARACVTPTNPVCVVQNGLEHLEERAGLPAKSEEPPARFEFGGFDVEDQGAFIASCRYASSMIVTCVANAASVEQAIRCARQASGDRRQPRRKLGFAGLVPDLAL